MVKHFVRSIRFLHFILFQINPDYKATYIFPNDFPSLLSDTPSISPKELEGVFLVLHGY